VGRSGGTPRVGAREPAPCPRRSARRGQSESPRHGRHLCPHQQYGSRARPRKHPPSEAVDGAAAGFRRQRFPDRHRGPRRPRGPRRHVAACLDGSDRPGTTVVPGTRSTMSGFDEIYPRKANQYQHQQTRSSVEVSSQRRRSWRRSPRISSG
jgi:hypothetical protein